MSVMILSRILSINKEDIPKAAVTISAQDLPQLIVLLCEKDDQIRYKAFLMLQSRSQFCGGVYPFWDTFVQKLKSENSYQRSIGLMLIAENARWDIDNKMDTVINDYLFCLNDEKPITVRQCIQALANIIPYKKHLLMRIASGLMEINLGAVKPSMKKLILIDILNVLMEIRRYETNDAIDGYIFEALSGGILDEKTKKQIKKAI